MIRTQYLTRNPRQRQIDGIAYPPKRHFVYDKYMSAAVLRGEGILPLLRTKVVLTSCIFLEIFAKWYVGESWIRHVSSEVSLQ